MSSKPNATPPGSTPGTRYGRYIVLAVAAIGRKSRVLCRCDCGTEKEVRLDGLKAGVVRSCGCLSAESSKAEKPTTQSLFTDILHHKFGRLLATSIHREVGRASRIVCVCDCGGQIVTIPSRLRNGSTTSCGCFHKERLVEEGKKTRDHGHAVDGELATGHTSIYRAWLKVRALCLAVQRKGAGLVNGEYDPRWKVFDEFLADFHEIGFGETVCRRDQSLPWSKSNCYVGLGPMDSRRKTREENAMAAQERKLRSF